LPSLPFSLPSADLRVCDVVCLGHALVDRLLEATSDVVLAAGLEVGSMTLVDGATARRLEGFSDSWLEVAGGSAANTAVGIASLGGSATFVGAVGSDEAGYRYAADLEAAGVRCVAHTVPGESATGLCHVFIGPDGERSMATDLGVAGEIDPAAVEQAGVADSKVVYIEGYLLDAPAAEPAVTKALEAARRGGTLISLSLSDPFVVHRHRDRILELLSLGMVDVLFGNEDEALALTGASVVGEAVRLLTRPGMLILVTRGPAGSIACSAEVTLEVAAARAQSVVDTTGAGDLFAAGVLYGLTHGREVAGALGLGSRVASEIIGNVGARPRTGLSGVIGDL
ncbi:MAG: adenosine kinase, partial [Acidimicrobiales bacterium]